MIFKQKSTKTRKIILLSVLTALGLLSFTLESLLPPLFVPGAKLGFSNVFTLLTLVLFSPWEAFVLLIVRTVLGSIFSGNVSALLYSLSAGFISIFCSAVLMKFFSEKISLVCISIISACVHNVLQLFVYSFLVSNLSTLSYAPFLLLAGIFSGFIVGFLTVTTIKTLPLSFFEKSIGTLSD